MKIKLLNLMTLLVMLGATVGCTSAPVSTLVSTVVPTNTPEAPTNTPTSTVAPTPVISADANSNGSMFRGDLQHTGVFDAGGIQPAGELKWKFETDGQVWSSPAIADGVLYFGSVDENLYAVDLETDKRNGDSKRRARSSPPRPLPMA